uniref:Saposin B-type domain-containing protein n=1 Tax=Strongyloides papillosus TaxID=174720 RepID=A0A0N5CA97_STREA
MKFLVFFLLSLNVLLTCQEQEYFLCNTCTNLFDDMRKILTYQDGIKTTNDMAVICHKIASKKGYFYSACKTLALHVVDIMNIKKVDLKDTTSFCSDLGLCPKNDSAF